jgi:nitrogen regulatory protein PII
MKLLMLIFDEAFEDQVRSRLHDAGVEHYTVIPGVFGQGPSSEPRWGTHVWPGHNVIYLIHLPEERLEALRPTLEGIKEILSGRGFKALVWEAREFQ